MSLQWHMFISVVLQRCLGEAKETEISVALWTL